MLADSNSALFQLMEQLEAGIEQSAKREAEKGVVQYRDSDFEEPVAYYRMPLRVVQEISGAPIGFELPKPMTPP